MKKGEIRDMVMVEMTEFADSLKSEDEEEERDKNNYILEPRGLGGL